MPYITNVYYSSLYLHYCSQLLCYHSCPTAFDSPLKSLTCFFKIQSSSSNSSSLFFFSLTFIPGHLIGSCLSFMPCPPPLALCFGLFEFLAAPLISSFPFQALCICCSCWLPLSTLGIHIIHIFSEVVFWEKLSLMTLFIASCPFELSTHSAKSCLLSNISCPLVLLLVSLLFNFFFSALNCYMWLFYICICAYICMCIYIYFLNMLHIKKRLWHFTEYMFNKDHYTTDVWKLYKNPYTINVTLLN